MEKIADLDTYLFHGLTHEDGVVPYLSPADLPGLSEEPGAFSNRHGERVCYAFFSRPDVCGNGRTVLFLHGVGAGRAAYLREIDTLCARGYRVCAPDYAGCGRSDGAGLRSLFAPADDVLALLDRVALPRDTVLMGHSLGGFTALQILRRRGGFAAAVLLAPFLSCRTFAARCRDEGAILAYERETEPRLFCDDVTDFLARAETPMLFFHETDDAVVPYAESTGLIPALGNPRLSCVTSTGRGHNPHYTDGALAFMRAAFSSYEAECRAGRLDTAEKRRAFFADKPAAAMTEQDPAIYDRIDAFLAALPRA